MTILASQGRSTWAISCVLGAGALLAAGCAANQAMAGTALLPGYFVGGASAIQAQIVAGPVDLNLSNSSSAACPCAGTNGQTQRNTVSTISGGSVVSAAANTSTSYGLKTATSALTRQTTTVASLNLLGGLITADAITAGATVSASGAKMTTGFAGTAVKNLVIAGKTVATNIPVNTVIPLSGLGSVTVKFVNSVTYGSQAAGIEVEGLRVQITQSNSLGLPVGSVLVVSEASAGFSRVQPAAFVNGYAQTVAVTASAGPLLQEAASVGGIAGIPACSGTGGETITSTSADVAAGGLLSVKAARTTAFGGPSGKATIAKTSANVGQISLLGGLITADGITAVAEESVVAGKSTPSTLGSHFGNLNVAGVTIANNVAPNTVISLAGLGYVALNEQPKAVGNQIQVNGLHIVVTVGSNSAGLPVGAEIFVAHAEAGG